MLPRKLKNFVLFNDGNAYLGEVESVTLPKLSRKMEEWRAGGMNGPVSLDQGMEAMEMDWVAGGFLRTLFSQWGTPTVDGVLLRFAGALQSDDLGISTPVEVVVRGRHKEIDFGDSKAGEKTEHKVKSVLSYYRLSMDGTVMIEVDFLNMIEVVDGVDRLAQARLSMGLL